MGDESPRPETVADRYGARPRFEARRVAIGTSGPSPSRRVPKRVPRTDTLGMLLDVDEPALQ